MPDRLDVAVIGAGPFGLSVAAHLPHRAVRVFGRADADLANAHAARHAAALRLGGDLAVGAARPGSDRDLGARGRRAARRADPTADFPALRGVVPAYVRARERPCRRGAPGSRRWAAEGDDGRRGRGGRSARARGGGCDAVPVRAAPVRRGDGRRRRLRDRAPGLQRVPRRARRRGRRRPRRARGRCAGPAGRSGGRGHRPLAPSLVHRPRAVPPQGRGAAPASTAWPIRSWATARRR